MDRTRALAFAVVIGLGMPLAALAQTARNVDGTITRVDEAGARMTIRHGPLKELDMGGMTMVFRIKDPELLKAATVGDQVRFDVERDQGQLTIIKIEKKK
jgi:Cu(I)/Ag(I) efflux system periplasmic protein CusF